MLALGGYAWLAARGGWRAGAAGLLLHAACLALALLPLARLALGRRHPTAPLAARLNALASALAFALVALQLPSLALVVAPAGVGLLAAELASARAPASAGVAPSLGIGAGWLALAAFAYAEPSVYPFASGFALAGLLLAGAAWRARRRATFAALVLLLALGACELACQASGVLVRGHVEARRRYFQELHQRDAALGYRPRAGLRGLELSYPLDPELRGVYSTDERGFRNVGRDYAAARDWFVGDSFTWGAWVSREDSFVGQLERRWGRPVVGLAAGGYGMLQYEALVELALRERPARLWLCVFANDLAGQIPLAESAAHYDAELPTRFTPAASLFGVLDRGLRALVLRARGWGPRAAREGVTLWPAAGAARDYLDSGHERGVEETYARILARCRGAEVALRVILIPSKERVYRADYERLFPQQGDYLRNELEGYRRLAELAAEAGVPCLDLTRTLRQAVGVGEAPYFALDPHWSPAGHALAAEAIARWEAQ